MASGKTILVVDDDPAMRHLIPHSLGKTGCNIVIARNAEEALAMASAQEIHLLVTDLMMKGMDGLHLVETLRQKTKYANLPAIILSGRWQAKFLAEAQSDKDTVLMKKPFSPIELASQTLHLLKL